MSARFNRAIMTAMLALASACGDGEPVAETDLTGLRLAMIYDGNLALDDLAISATLDGAALNSGTVQPANRTATTEITETVAILVDDALAGRTIDLAIEGRKSNQKLASGKGSAILIAQKLVDVTIRLEPVTPSSCGNGTLDTGEVCDDQNERAGDGCSKSCAIEPGYTCIGVPSVCELDPPIECGDGMIAGLEACDDQNTIAGDGCSALCAIEPGYACIGAPSVCARTCGDTMLGAGELCDDGNLEVGDGCTDTCAIEPGFECPVVGAPCTPINTECGNGRIIGNEACDDANTIDGDGCDARCAIEMGWLCTNEPSICTLDQATCGDGLIEGAETCDDRNLDRDDGCNANCRIEQGWVCTGEPSACSRCGNGMIDERELCDGNVVGGETCLSRGHLDGDLRCSADCGAFDLTACGSPIDTSAEIQEAIDQAYAIAGGPEVVAIQPGTYQPADEIVFDECQNNNCPNGPSGLTLRPLEGTVSIYNQRFRVRSGNNRIENLAILGAPEAVLFEDQGEVSGGNTLVSNLFGYENVNPIAIIVVQSDRNTILANRVRSLARQGGEALRIDGASGTIVAMNVLYGRFESTIHLSNMDATAAELTYIDQNSVWIQGGGVAVWMEQAANLCYRNNLIWGNGFSTGLQIETASFAMGCTGGDTANNLAENHGTQCSGFDCLSTCTLGGALCDVSGDPGFDQGLMSTRAELCIRPASSALIDAGLELGYDLVDGDAAEYHSTAPELGAREAGTSRVYGGAASTCP